LQPAQWQLSADGKRLVGHMTLRKPITDNDSVEGRTGEPGGAVGRGALGEFHNLYNTIYSLFTVNQSSIFRWSLCEANSASPDLLAKFMRIRKEKYELPFSALTLLVGRQERHPACKN